MAHQASRFLIPLFSGLLLAPTLMAQAEGEGATEQAEPLEQEAEAMTQDFDDETLERFADAYVEVGEIHRTYSDELQDAEATEEAQDLQQRANNEMVEAIQGTGMEVQEYSAVAAALERDPDMREEVVQMIEQRQ